MAFKEWWIVAFYVVSMAGLAFHLSHGFQSAFRTLGLSHKKYMPFVQALGLVFSIGVCLGFAVIPVITFLKFGLNII
jgi:succinate dehydrogenase / fumarate reductase, cytochrome b subunit